jgi:hypothetical protein
MMVEATPNGLAAAAPGRTDTQSALELVGLDRVVLQKLLVKKMRRAAVTHSPPASVRMVGAVFWWE